MILERKNMRRTGDSPKKGETLQPTRSHYLIQCDLCKKEEWKYTYSFDRSETSAKNNSLNKDMCNQCWRDWKKSLGFWKQPNRIIHSDYHPTKTTKYAPKVHTNGYIRTWITDLNHPRLAKNKRDPNPSGGRVYEHLLVVEKRIGRYLTCDEQVHHLNGDKRCNESDNLFLCKNSRHHNEIHNKMERFIFDLIKDGKVKLNLETEDFEFIKGQHE